MRSVSLAGTLSQAIHSRTLVRALMVLALPILLAMMTGNAIWLKACLASICAFIVVERTPLRPFGLVLHSLAVTAGFLALLIAMSQPLLFILGCALLANLSVVLGIYGEKLRLLGSFIFIPALYLACETAEIADKNKILGISSTTAAHLASGVAFLPYMAIALLPVLALALADYLKTTSVTRGRSQHGWRIILDTSRLGAPIVDWRSAVAVTLAVATAAFCVEWLRLDESQWVIWSAASVITGDLASARKKLGDRATGVVLGVPLGLVLGTMAPHSAVLYDLATLAAVLTLVAFRSYVISYGTRCALIAFAVVVAGQSVAIAGERVMNVLLGGCIGIGFVLAVNAMTNRWRQRVSDQRT